MKIGLRVPVAVTWEILDGATFDTDVALSNRSPGDVTRMVYTGGSPDAVRLRASWAAGQCIGAVGVAGLAVLSASGSPTAYTWAAAPTGIGLRARGRQLAGPWTFALGGNATSATSTLLPDKTTSGWIITASNTTELVGLELEIQNTGGWLSTGDLLEIGEIGLWQTVDVGGQPGWSSEVIDPTIRLRTLAAQVKRKSRQTYRQYQISLVPAEEADVRGAGLLNSEDYESVAAALRFSNFCCIIPHSTTEAGVFSQELLNRTAIMGVASPGAIGHVQRRVYGQPYTFEETPALGELP